MNEKNNERPVDLADQKSYRHWTRVSIRFGDEDRMGHVNNAAYTVWLESARVGYLETLFAPEEGLEVRRRAVRLRSAPTTQTMDNAELAKRCSVKRGTAQCSIPRNALARKP